MSVIEQERNFRTHYYEKVGFRAVEEKKSVENLLKEQPIKREKLTSFCLRFGIPAVYRTYVWKILLDILPLNQSSQEYVWEHRSKQVEELKSATLLVRPQCRDMSLEHVVSSAFFTLAVRMKVEKFLIVNFTACCSCSNTLVCLIIAHLLITVPPCKISKT